MATTNNAQNGFIPSSSNSVTDDDGDIFDYFLNKLGKGFDIYNGWSNTQEANDRAKAQIEADALRANANITVENQKLLNSANLTKYLGYAAIGLVAIGGSILVIKMLNK